VDGYNEPQINPHSRN